MILWLQFYIAFTVCYLYSHFILPQHFVSMIEWPFCAMRR